MSESYQRRFDAEMGESDYETLLKVAGSDLSCRRVGKAVIMYLADRTVDWEEDLKDLPVDTTSMAEHCQSLVLKEMKRFKEDPDGVD